MSITWIPIDMTYDDLVTEAFTILGSVFLNDTETATQETVDVLQNKYDLDVALIKDAVSDAFDRWVSVYSKDD